MWIGAICFGPAFAASIGFVESLKTAWNRLEFVISVGASELGVRKISSRQM